MRFKNNTKSILFSILLAFLCSKTELIAQPFGGRTCFLQLQEMGIPTDTAMSIGMIVSFLCLAAMISNSRSSNQNQQQQPGAGCCVIFLAVGVTIWAIL